MNLLKQAADKIKHVKALVCSNEYSSKGIQKIFIHRRKHRLKCRAAVKKGFNEKKGPFVKRFDTALQEIGVERQQYFGGACTENHAHKALKV